MTQNKRLVLTVGTLLMTVALGAVVALPQTNAVGKSICSVGRRANIASPVGAQICGARLMRFILSGKKCLVM